MSKSNAKPYKQKKVKLDKKMSVLTYILTLICAVMARTVQLQTNMDFETGKYLDSSLSKNYTLWILIIGFILTFLVMYFGKSRDKAIKSCILINPMRLRADRLNKKFSPKAGAAMFLVAFLMVFDIFLDLSSIINRNREISTDENPVSIFAGVTTLNWFMYVFAVIAVITFISLGTNILKGEGFTRGNCVFLSTFAIWRLLQIFSMIGSGEIIGVHSEKVYIMLTAMSSAAFFMYAARVFAGFEKKHTRFWMCMLGYMSSVIAAVSTVPRYVIYFTKTYEERFGMSTPDTADAGIIFATVAVVAVFWSTYVYRVMPKLSLTGKRRWSSPTVTVTKMGSIEDERK